jgi:hypothetical protein
MRGQRDVIVEIVVLAGLGHVDGGQRQVVLAAYAKANSIAARPASDPSTPITT